jgi:hypothetical protein
VSVPVDLYDWVIPVSASTLLLSAIRRLQLNRAEMPSAFSELARGIDGALRGRAVRKILKNLDRDKLKRLKTVKATRKSLELTFWEDKD